MSFPTELRRIVYENYANANPGPDLITLGNHADIASGRHFANSHLRLVSLIDLWLTVLLDLSSHPVLNESILEIVITFLAFSSVPLRGLGTGVECLHSKELSVFSQVWKYTTLLLHPPNSVDTDSTVLIFSQMWKFTAS